MNHNPLLDLSDVTLCAVDTINPLLAARALDISMSQCRFGDALLLAHEAAPTRARFVQIDRLQSLEAYSAFMLKQLGNYITTPWVLVVQWDGYVVDASRWTQAFFEYDYIGARWPVSNGMNVGNGGFSLRSAKLLKALADDRFPVPPNGIEDVLICDTWRPTLEADYGIRFATADIADHFSYEYGVPARPTFGFHGVFNLWRHVDDNTMIDIIREIDIRTLTTPRGVALLKNYCDLRKFACVKAMSLRARTYWSTESFVKAFVANGLREEAARQYVALCDAA